jgi:ectoine hydroxylase-related dioxygenase (phytanoyl-CoA dioxygenase family)
MLFSQQDMANIENEVKKTVNKAVDSAKKLPNISLDTAESTNVVEKDLRKLGNKVKSDTEEIKASGSHLMDLIKNDYKRLGFTNFVREYKYIFIMIFLIMALSLLWLRNRKI